MCPPPPPPTPIPRGVSIQSCMISCFHHNRVLPCPVPALAHPAHRSTALRHFLDHTVSDSDGQDLNLSPLGGSGRSPKTVLAFESQCATEPRLGTSQLAQLSPLSASCLCPHTEDTQSLSNMIVFQQTPPSSFLAVFVPASLRQARLWHAVNI